MLFHVFEWHCSGARGDFLSMRNGRNSAAIVRNLDPWHGIIVAATIGLVSSIASLAGEEWWER
jgi:hypothetical protein